ncbi:hypothetical protein M0802_016147 [Mischocyttarus mexicanus]|nr:hypothetical protein M0802_016147 [Mischocyttarus mexicanus]
MGVVKVPEIRLYWSKDPMFRRILYTDSYYTSVPLAKELLQKKTFLCGTLRANRSFLPEAAKVKQKKGEIISLQKEGIKFVNLTDKRSVLMLTTCKYHKCSLMEVTTRGHKTVRKPDCVISYNKAKKEVDISDQMSAYYSSLIVRKTDKCEPLSPKSPLTHNLAKYEGSLRKTRKRCKNCYLSIAKQERRENTIKKTIRVNTYCPACKNKPTLCIPCFAKVHY